MATNVIMPQMGESVVEGTVARWLKQEGEAVAEYEPLLEVETDKVTSEVTAIAAGTLLRIYVGEGRTVQAGAVLAVIGQPGEAIPDAPAALGFSMYSVVMVLLLMFLLDVLQAFFDPRVREGVLRA